MAESASESSSDSSSKRSVLADLSTYALVILLTIGILFMVPMGLRPFGLSSLIAGVLGLAVVPLLRYWKTGQVIREEGPQSHFSKAGTPTMGGIYFIPVGLVVALVWTHLDPDVMAAVGLTLGYGFVGWLDDFQVIRKQSNKGLTPKQKLILQLVIGIGFCLWILWRGIGWSLVLPGIEIPLSWAFWPLAIFVMLGTSNAVNLTDGMDGLASGVVAILFVGLGVLISPEHPALTLFCLCMSGSCLGFLWQNRYPARVFMGDTGSLGLGGALAAVALLSQSLWALAIMGGLLVVEALSVILQVSYFKYTKQKTGEGKRLLRMSPLHHHLELGGWSETKVVFVFYLITGILVVGGYWIPRLV